MWAAGHPAEGTCRVVKARGRTLGEFEEHREGGQVAKAQAREGLRRGQRKPAGQHTPGESLALISRDREGFKWV